MREELDLPEDQKCLFVYDIFKAQSTDKYRECLDENNIAYVQVRPNLTHIFQHRVLKVNSFVKIQIDIDTMFLFFYIYNDIPIHM